MTLDPLGLVVSAIVVVAAELALRRARVARRDRARSDAVPDHEHPPQ